MPGTITHYLFAKDCLNNIVDEKLVTIIKDNLDVYILGCQGPNFFCYYNYLPFLNNENLSLLSTKIHTEYINDFFKNMIFYCNDISCIRHVFDNDKFCEITLAYLLGFISHYVLDTSIHPYIYSLQFRLTTQYKKKSFNELHKSIETHIDKLLLKKVKNLTPSQFNDYNGASINDNELIIICDMYTFLLKKVFNKSLLYSDIIKCLKMFEKTEKKLNNTNNLYSRLYLKIKSFTSKNSNVNSKIYSNHKHCINDLLNTNNLDWIDPFTNTTYSKSFEELYNESLIFYNELVSILNLYLNNKVSINEFLNIINNNSYFTNQNWKTNYKILQSRNDNYES